MAAYFVIQALALAFFIRGFLLTRVELTQAMGAPSDVLSAKHLNFDCCPVP